MAATSMTSQERVHAAAKGLPVDRVPVFYWINTHAVCKLISQYHGAKNLFWNIAGRYLWRRFANNGELEAPLRLRALPLLSHLYGVGQYALELGGDVAVVPFGTNEFWGRMYRESGKWRIKDGMGAIRRVCGIYLEVEDYPLKTAEDLANYRFPDLTHEKHYDRIRAFRKKNPDACICVDNFGVQDIFSTWLMEMSQFMLALYRYPEEVKDFQQRLNQWQIDVARRSVEAGADVILIYDDYGHTTNTFLSTDMWKEFTYPHLKKKIEAVHEAEALAMLHSCGHQMPYLKYYAEAELDMLQAFQPGANNDLKTAYSETEDRICIVTGIDIQRGETMTPEEIRDDILQFYRIGKENGRFVIGTTHMMQYTMPDENIRMIFKTIGEIQRGEHN